MRAYIASRWDRRQLAISLAFRGIELEQKAGKRATGRRNYRQSEGAYAARKRTQNRLRYERKPEAALLAAARRKARLRALPSSLTKAEWAEIIECFDSRCAYCLRRLGRPEIEHLLPVSRGVCLAADNVVPACLKCNRAKSNRPIWSMVNVAVAPNEVR